MTTDHGGTITHAQTANWRNLPRYERCHDTITEGDAIGVLLANRPDRVWLNHADYQRVIATYGAIRWRWHEKLGSVVLRDRPHHCASVARLVIGGAAKGFVQYADGDRLNLRGANLSVDVTKLPRRDGLSEVRAEKAAQLERERAVRRTQRAEKAAKAAAAPKAQKRSSTAPTIRPFVLPPPVTVQPQAAPPAVRVIPKKPVTIVQGVPRSARVSVPAGRVIQPFTR